MDIVVGVSTLNLRRRSTHKNIINVWGLTIIVTTTRKCCWYH